MMAVLTVVLCAQCAWAVPVIVDGYVDSNDNYVAVFTDPTDDGVFGDPATGEANNFNISSLSFDRDSDLGTGWFYFGLETVGIVPQSGLVGAPLPKQSTDFWVDFTNCDSPHFVEVKLTTGAVAVWVDGLQAVEGPANDFVAVVNKALEVKLDLSKYFPGDVFDFTAHLDNNGGYADDELSYKRVIIPEPSIGVFLGSSVLLSFMRRRRHHLR